MSVIYKNEVKRLIDRLPKETRYSYRSNLKRIFKSIEGYSPTDNDELYFYVWTDLTATKIENALIAAGHGGTVSQCVSSWRMIIHEYLHLGLLGFIEAHNKLELPYAESGWTTQAMPLKALLPPELSSSPSMDTSRHVYNDERGTISDITINIKFTNRDEIRLDNEESIWNFTKGRQSSVFLHAIHAWLAKAPDGSSAPIAKAIGTSTQVIRMWRTKFTS